MRILIIGGGGREHALAWKLAASPRVTEIIAVPGNPGMASLARCVNMKTDDLEALADFAVAEGVDLTVVGPEAPLVAGLTDVFAARGLKVFGPSAAAAQLEGSKAFAKDIMARYGIPTAAYFTTTSSAAAKQYIREQGAPIVVKADGLAAGKGVVVAMTEAEALAAVDMMMEDKAFGDAGSVLVLEEMMVGEEASLLAFCDGKTVKAMVAAQDHKRVFDGDQGPNTGGMGTYAPAPVMTPTLVETAVKTVLEPMMAAMAAEGTPYQGCLYAGLMITDVGPRVVEFNARFGDPETQVVLPLLKSDLAEILLACAEGRLDEMNIEWSDGAAVCVVLASGGYPGDYKTGLPITGTEVAEASGAMVFHAGTQLVEGQLATAGGRVLGVVACGADIASAQKATYEAVEHIHFPEAHYRRDIAWRAINR